MNSTLHIRILVAGLILMSVATLFPLFASACTLTITDVRVSDLRDGKAVVSWTTPENKTTAYVYLGETKTSLDKVFWDAHSAADHALEVDGLDKNKTYYYKVIVSTANGTLKDSGLKSFSTSCMTFSRIAVPAPAPVDTRAPQFTESQVTDNADGRMTLRVSSDEEVTVVAEYGMDQNYSHRVSSTTYAAGHELTLKNLTGGSNYYVRLTIRDRAGNTQTRYLTAVAYVAPVKALTISGLDAEEGRGGSVRSRLVRFSTSVPARSHIYYGTSASALKKSLDVSASYETEHGIELTELLPNTAYYYRVEAHDAKGRSVSSGTYSFWTGDVRRWYVTGSFVRAAGDRRIYIIYAGTKTWIENPAAFLGLGFRGDWVQEVPAWTLDDYQEGASVKNFNLHPSGSLVKYANDPTVYLIEGNLKHPISSPQAFERNGFSWDHIVTIPKSETYRTGSNVN